ncbi:hypothetical protein BGZ61DRAFT_559795 [Ilyonectria robusta]|uniref:uncharacterized protein n=1 Tax=Ilyonectria robusta TaxID=1079257 RepID=UPI001E8CDD04|nr:uncharacterized protein BGZ61DRAFT_559795 [Ilyonectria robusta]KAH8734245.1 hypothetical protein BGZ61DRAFT_559795 [Ilyonectria robusta]
MPSYRMKAKRITRACDFCNRRGLKCREETTNTNGNESPCLTCVDYGQECTRNRQPKKRGTKPRGSLTRTVQETTLDLSSGLEEFTTVGGVSGSRALRSRKIITALLDVYLDTIHPMFPFFCEREIWVGWREGSFPGDASDYMSLMCMCALSAQHVGNGALFTEDASTEPATFAQDYLSEAIALVPVDFESASLLNLIRSYGFLALLGAQNGNSAMLNQYLGLYHGLSGHFNLHDESRWPGEITTCEREVRRRLWWTMYRLEVHTACVLGSMIRCSETQCDVGYPSGPHHPAFIPGRDGQFEDWFSGWNSTTDLYRVLEHAVSNFRSKHRRHDSIVRGSNDVPTRLLMESLGKIQEQLQPQFGAVFSPSSDNGRNRCGFQACNILCTIHLARMITSLTGEDSSATACQTARDMMDNMNSIPLEYIRATGSPLLQQLAGVGHMLLVVAKKQMPSHEEYLMLRDVSNSIIGFLTRFGEYSKLATVAQRKLSAQLNDFDKHTAGKLLEGFPGEDCPTLDNDGTRGLDFNLFTLDYETDNGFFGASLLRPLTWPSNSRSLE